MTSEEEMIRHYLDEKEAERKKRVAEVAKDINENYQKIMGNLMPVCKDVELQYLFFWPRHEWSVEGKLIFYKPWRREYTIDGWESYILVLAAITGSEHYLPDSDELFIRNSVKLDKEKTSLWLTAVKVLYGDDDSTELEGMLNEAGAGELWCDKD